MFNKNETKSKKWQISFGLIGIFLLAIVASGCGGESTTENKQENQSIIEVEKIQPIKESEENFLFEKYIEENKIKQYKIVSEEDISVKILGDKNLSDYSIQELENLPVNFRMKYQIVISSDVILEELKSTLAQVIKEKATKNSDIDEIVVQTWESEESLEGGNFSIGNAEWCPNGKWASMTPEIAKNNNRDSYRIVYDINERTLEAIKKNEEENLFGLNEEQRKEIFKEIVGCEDLGYREAMRYYRTGCEACLEFIEVDMYKEIDKERELSNDCKKKINIDEKIMSKISAEGVIKRWIMPESLPVPDCCK